MTQLSFLDNQTTPAREADNPVEVERRRLRGQCAAILARLKCGPATNRELAGLSLKYTSRISDLRAAGYVINVVVRNRETGLNVYELMNGALR